MGIGRFFVNCYPIVFIFAGLLLQPGAMGRKDQHPWYDVVDRLRYYTSQMIVTVAFVVIPAVGSQGTTSFASLDKYMPWLNNWSLFAFVFHKSVYVLIDNALPWVVQVLIIYSFCLPFYMLHECRKPASGSSSKNGNLQST